MGPVTSGTDAPRVEIHDPQVMRALAHPARMAIMEYLMSGVTATATECAEVCGLSPSATSYHLRALARAGLIEEAPSRGDGRERVWHSPAAGYTSTAVSSHDPELRAAEHELIDVFLVREDVRARQWLAKEADQPIEWQEAAVFNEAGLLVTAEELAVLTRQVVELFEPYTRRRRRPDPPPGAREVFVVLRAHPMD